MENVRLLGATLALAAVSVLIAACGGDDGGSSTATGSLNCNAMADTSYRFSGEVMFDTELPAAADPSLGELHWKSTVEGEVEDEDSIRAVINNTDYGAVNTTLEAIIDNGEKYRFLPDFGWQDLQAAPDYRPIPYLPFVTCEALAVDFDPAEHQGREEEVNGIPSTRYELSDFATDMPDRMPDIGPSSDVSVYVNTFSGIVWVADAGYISKLDLTGVGYYPDGKKLTARFILDIKDWGADINVEKPEDL